MLYGNEQITALKRDDVKAKKQVVKGSVYEEYDLSLFEKLRVLRKKFAEEQQVPPYVIFSDKTLHEMCTYYPVTLSDMRKINGVGEAKLERYGEYFINEISKYMRKKKDYE